MRRFIIWINKIIGNRYLINHRSREVHDLKNEHKNCRITTIKNREFARRKRAMDIIAMVEEYNGCCWCNKEHDNG